MHYRFLFQDMLIAAKSETLRPFYAEKQRFYLFNPSSITRDDRGI